MNNYTKEEGRQAWRVFAVAVLAWFAASFIPDVIGRFF